MPKKRKRVKLSDKQAKKVLLGFPNRTSIWPPPQGKGYWLRAQPRDGYASAPKLFVPGATMFSTQPDGLWVYFAGLEACDVIIFEVCGSPQNLNDKRARYMPSGHSLVLKCRQAWLEEAVRVQGGGESPRWECVKSIDSAPTGDAAVPVRNLRVLYAIPDWLYQDWCRENAPAAHEFFCPHSVLHTWSSHSMQEFLYRMSPAAQFMKAIKAPSGD